MVRIVNTNDVKTVLTKGAFQTFENPIMEPFPSINRILLGGLIEVGKQEQIVTLCLSFNGREI